MSYSNTPNTGDTLGSTKVPINTNFSLIQTTMKVDHNGMGETNFGKHNVIHLVKQSTEGQTTTTESAVYTKAIGNGDLYARSPNHVDALPAGEYQLTTFSDGQISTFGNSPLDGVTFQNAGWTFLPGGLLLQYGRIPGASADTTILFPVAFDISTFKPIITLGNLESTVNARVKFGSITSTQFEILQTLTLAGGCYWMAIGKK